MAIEIGITGIDESSLVRALEIAQIGCKAGSYYY